MIPEISHKWNQNSILHLIEMFSVNLPHAARSRLAERTRLDSILASWGGLALCGATRSPGPTGERWSGRWRGSLLIFGRYLCVVEVFFSVWLLWAPTISDEEMLYVAFCSSAVISAVIGHTHPKWRMRMCRFIPTRDVNTFSQPGHRHLYAALLKLCQEENEMFFSFQIFPTHPQV